MTLMEVLTLDGLSEFKGLIDTELAKSFKSAKFDESTRVLSFYKTEVADGKAAFTVTIPKTDVSGLMEKLSTANVGNVVITKADGTVIDGGVALADLATKTEVQAVDEKADTNTEAITVLNGTDKVEGSVKKQIKTAKDSIEAKIGTVTDNKTVVEMIEDAKKVSTYDDTQVKADIKKNADAIEAHKIAIDTKVTTLVGNDTDKSVRTIANEELAAQLIPEGAKESLNTLQEIAAWIQSHPDDASAMNEAITKLETIINGIGDIDNGEKATIVAYVADAIDTLKIGDYAKAADLTALAGRVANLENLATSEKIAKWDASEQNAKDYADSLAVNYDSAGSATAAETNSKAYADNLNTAMDTKVAGVTDRVTELETKVGEGITAITSEEINALFATE